MLNKRLSTADGTLDSHNPGIQGPMVAANGPSNGLFAGNHWSWPPYDYHHHDIMDVQIMDIFMVSYHRIYDNQTIIVTVIIMDIVVAMDTGIPLIRHPTE